MKAARRLLVLALGTVLVLYLLACAGLYLVQDALIFPVPDVPRDRYDQLAARQGIETFDLHTEDGVRIYGWHAKGDGSRAVLFFHGNGGGLSTVGWLAEQLPGVDVFGIAYRGYPGSEGSPSEAGLHKDAEALWKHVSADFDHIVYAGQSMGGGVAVQLAARHPPKALVLDSTFLSIQRIVDGRFPIFPTRLLLKNPFRSEDHAPELRVPTLLIHGDHDTLIPVSHGRGLAKLLPQVRYIEVPGGGHDQFLPDRDDVRPAYTGFLRAHLR